MVFVNLYKIIPKKVLLQNQRPKTKDLFFFMKSFGIKPLIVAHRGASALAPENTLAAFQKAFDDGAEGIEFDVQLAKDAIPVVVHDEDLNRLSGTENFVARMTSVELQKLDVGSWFNLTYPKYADDEFSKEFIPTLAHLFEFLQSYKGLLYVELKCGTEAADRLVEIVCKLIEKTNLLPQIILKSFDLKALALAKKILPEIRTASLFAPKILRILREKEYLLDEAQKYEADEISIHYSLATKGLVKKAKERGLPTTIWTADNPIWVKRALDFGINAIITNNPARLLAKKEITVNGER